MKTKLRVSGNSIALVGNFAPLAFLPHWFAAKAIIAETEAREAQLTIAVPELVSFSLSWLNVVVESQKFSATSTKESDVRLLDLVTSTFALISETPVSAVGINQYGHYEMPDAESWHRLGDLLAPKEPWGNFALGTGSRRAGLRSLTIEFAHLVDEPRGRTHVRVEPSTIVTKNGLFIDINDHYDLGDTNLPGDGAEASELVRSRWGSSLAIAKEITQQILGAT